MRIRFACLTLGLSLWLAGCAQMAPATEQTAYNDIQASNVFRVGYTLIQSRYINPVALDQLALAGVEDLSVPDEGLVLTHRDNVLHIDLPHRPDVELPLPKADDVEAWADLTARVIGTARSDSPSLSAQTPEELYQLVFKGALAKLDRYSRYASAGVARNQRANREGYGGIGIRLNQETPGAALVEAVMPDTPAARAGVLAGDHILRIDDVDATALDGDEVVDRLRGPINSAVKLTLARDKTAEPIVVSVNRALIFTPTVEYEAKGDAAVIRLSAFNQSTSRNLTRAIERARREMGDGLKGIVLDMRDNPGGLLDQAVAVSDLFLASGRIVSTRGRHPDSMQVYDATGRDMTNNLPLVVLVNGQSASAAEIVAAALQDRGRAVVVGSNTYGKGTVQNITRLPNDGELILTWSRFHAPSGYAIADLGVLPNVCTSAPEAKAAAASGQISPAWLEQPVLFSAWRINNAGAREPAELTEMRNSCPRTKETNAFDLTVATRLIENPQLYSQALQQSTTTIAAPQAPEPTSTLGAAAQTLPTLMPLQPKS